jgi:hypothetical protein
MIRGENHYQINLKNHKQNKIINQYAKSIDEQTCMKTLMIRELIGIIYG